MKTFVTNSISAEAILVLSLGWIAYTIFRYIRIRTILSAYPIYHADGDSASTEAIPVLELHSSAKILSDGFAKFGVRRKYRSVPYTRP